jgi:hypothetical protein
MSWNKKDVPVTSAAPDLSALAQAAPPAKQSATEPESVPKKIPTPPAALTPEVQAYMNSSLSMAVKEIFASMGPLLSSIALTPEKLAQAEALRRAPDPAAVARELRERKMTQQEAEENRANLLRNQAACPHRYPTGQLSTNVVRNYPDRRERFICMLCQSFFQPRR